MFSGENRYPRVIFWPPGWPVLYYYWLTSEKLFLILMNGFFDFVNMGKIDRFSVKGDGDLLIFWHCYYRKVNFSLLIIIHMVKKGVLAKWLFWTCFLVPLELIIKWQFYRQAQLIPLFKISLLELISKSGFSRTAFAAQKWRFFA